MNSNSVFYICVAAVIIALIVADTVVRVLS